MKRLLPILLLLAGCQTTANVLSNPLGTLHAGAPPAASALVRKFAPLPPPPPDPSNPVADNVLAAQLGQRLFYDTGYSRTGTFSCASCHQPEHAFSDGRKTGQALGIGKRNTPSLGLVAYSHWQGWAGRADSLAGQSLAAMENPIEMGMDRVAAARRLLETEQLAYDALFGPPPDISNWPAEGGENYNQLPAATRYDVEMVARNLGNALGAYMRRLIPGPAPFDRYATGDLNAVTPEVVAGFEVFSGKARCAQCHNGPTFSDGQFHNLGVPQEPQEVDHGRLDDLAKLLNDPFRFDNKLPAPTANDDGRFKTPTLRDITRTAPYWHAGSFDTLEALVDFDLAGGLNVPGKPFPGTRDPKFKPVKLTMPERQALLAFLRALEMTPVPLPWGGPPQPGLTRLDRTI